MKRPLCLLGIGFLALIHCPPTFSKSPDPAPANIGKKAADFSLKDTKGRSVSLEDYKDKKAIVVVFIGTECPINNAYMPRLVQLHKSYSAKGVQFLGINSNQLDSVARVAEHAQQHKLPFPVLKDEGNEVADQWSAQRTPEAFVLDAGHKICYRGRIDDQYGIDYKRAKPTRRDLAAALDEVLAGRPVSQPSTQVSGCYIGRAAKPKAAGPITYSKQIVRILQKNCQECHRPEAIGPMALLSYEDVTAWSDTIREVVQDNRMPPWYADPRYGHFANDRRLPPEDRKALLAWLDQGMPRGDDKDLPPPREFPKGWTIGKPDVVFSMPDAFKVPADMPRGGIPYKRFFVSTKFKEDRWIQRAEARPGAPGVVHHIVVFYVPPGEDFWPGNPKTPTLCGTAPGDMPLILPPGTAKRVPAGSQLVFEMHYTPNGVAQEDRSSVGLIFAKEEPKYYSFAGAFANVQFEIPPGHDNYKVEFSFTFRQDHFLLNFMPHMHLRGKDFLYEVIYPDGKKETVLSVPRYNFNWQSVYRLKEPLLLPKGTRLHMVAHFDNSAKNPNNPDPTKLVRWGDQTWEEMMIGWVDLACERTAK
jgi:peroxiredoxin